MTLSNAAIELVADAHYALPDQANPPADAPGLQRARDLLGEIIQEEPAIPNKVVQARAALNDEETPNPTKTRELLLSYLTGTDYDPNDPNSFHPSNQ